MTDVGLGARCPHCNHADPGGDARQPCGECKHTRREAAFFVEGCVGDEWCSSPYHHRPTGLHFWTFEGAQPPEVEIAVMKRAIGLDVEPNDQVMSADDRAAAVDLRRAELEVRIAEWDDALTYGLAEADRLDGLAQRLDGKHSAAQGLLQAAQAALAPFSVDQLEEAGELIATRSKRENDAVRALRRLYGATQDVEIHKVEAVHAHRAAKAYRSQIVAPAQALLASMKAELKDLEQ